ncbi:GNAT family N-acetyltransferase [Myroides albus]|uniref:GNAT family N-acetyltransferase n=1 Tax=Myroides albus TaxID=2562892 RepID=UPI0021598D63|nr:GNAT family N-acetyltransferase [Myroides albus]UVD79576.1 GNAT family N-acetyltransferase [Myroides albus]
MKLSIQLATIDDLGMLTQTAMLSKQVWGYSQELMNLWKEELTITKENLIKAQVYKCFVEQEYIGFFELRGKGAYVTLEHFWLLPKCINKGFGKEIIKQIKVMSHQLGFKYIEVYADPNANLFYEKMSGVCVKQILTKVPGRMMNIYHLPVVEQQWVDLHTVGLVVVEEGKLLLAYSNNKKAWYLPGGKIDQGEESKVALIREVEEELSLSMNSDRLQYFVHIIAPAYGEKLNIMMQQDCYVYELRDEKIKATNEIGAVKYFSFEDYKKEEVQVPGVLMVFEVLGYTKS